LGRAAKGIWVGRPSWKSRPDRRRKVKEVTMPKGNIYWRKLTPQHRVKETPAGWETAGGKTIYWHGQEARAAQEDLTMRFIFDKRRK